MSCRRSDLQAVHCKAEGLFINVHSVQLHSSLGLGRGPCEIGVVISFRRREFDEVATGRGGMVTLRPCGSWVRVSGWGDAPMGFRLGWEEAKAVWFELGIVLLEVEGGPRRDERRGSSRSEALCSSLD